MPLYLHFGAGNIGRALAGPVFSRAGYDVLFVDADQAVVDAIHSRRSYRVVVKDDLRPGEPDEFYVESIDALSVFDRDAVTAAVAKADLIGMAVGSANVGLALKSMVPGLVERASRPVSILLCENFNGVAEFSQEFLSNELPQGRSVGNIGFVETSIGKMVPIMPDEVRREDPLLVWGEAYNRIVADRQGFVDYVPDGIEGLDLKDNFQAYVEQKLYVHNLGHSACACYGFQKNYELICDAIADPDIRSDVSALMRESALALVKRWPTELTEEMQLVYVEDLIRRFGNRSLGDTIFRVGRDLPRKLAPDDRFMGALRLVQESGGDCSAMYRAIAAALQFKAVDESGDMFDADVVFHKRLKDDGVESVLHKHCGLTSDECRIVSELY